MRRPLSRGKSNQPSATTRWWLGAAAMLLLAACNLGAGGGSEAPPTEGSSLLPDKPHIERQTLSELFGAAETNLQTSGDLEVIAFRCTIIEGTLCWFGERAQDGAVAGDLARRVIDQIGPGAIENANRNEVAVQCFRPLGGGDAYCEIDWGQGAGWEALPVG